MNNKHNSSPNSEQILEKINSLTEKYNLENKKPDFEIINNLFDLFESYNLLADNNKANNLNFKNDIFMPLIKQILSGDPQVRQYFFTEVTKRLEVKGDFEWNFNNKKNLGDNCSEMKIIEGFLEYVDRKEFSPIIKGVEDEFLDILLKIQNKLLWQLYTVEFESWHYSSDFWDYELIDTIEHTIEQSLSHAIVEKITESILHNDFLTMRLIYEKHFIDGLNKQDIISLFTHKDLNFFEFLIINYAKLDPREDLYIEDIVSEVGLDFSKFVIESAGNHLKQSLREILEKKDDFRTEYFIKFGIYQYLNPNDLYLLSSDALAHFMIKVQELRDEDWCYSVISIYDFLGDFFIKDDFTPSGNERMKNYIMKVFNERNKYAIEFLYYKNLFDLLTKDEFFEILNNSKPDFFESVILILQESEYYGISKKIDGYLLEYIQGIITPGEALALDDLNKILNVPLVFVDKLLYDEVLPGIKFEKNLVVGLKLSRCEIKNLPDSIGNLKDLKYLYLYDNNLEILPETIGKLQNLECLDLGRNKIKDLPASIWSIKNLKLKDWEFLKIKHERNLKKPNLKLDVKKLIYLVTQASNGKDDLMKAAIGFNGYGFIFRSFESVSQWTSNVPSSRATFVEDLEDPKHYEMEIYHAVKYAASLKTLIPNMELGGYEILFHVWMFVKTPDNKLFPAKFYYGPTGIAIGGYHPPLDKLKTMTKKDLWSEDFAEHVNFSPYGFNKDQREGFVKALRGALQKVPKSHFECVFKNDKGKFMMGYDYSGVIIEDIEDDF